MQVVIVFAALFALALAAPQGDKDAVVVRYDSENIGVDGYNFAYETSHGIAHQESAVLKNAGTDAEAIAVTGQFSYKGADGTLYTVTYTADENGFQPQGAHLPHA